MARLGYGREPPTTTYEEALDSFRTANALYPTSSYGRPNVKALIHEGDCHVTLGNIEEAKRCYTSACEVDASQMNSYSDVSEARKALARLET